MQKYRRAKRSDSSVIRKDRSRLLGGQIQQGGQLGKLLMRERTKNRKLLRLLQLFEGKVIRQLEIFKKRFLDARSEIQFLKTVWLHPTSLLLFLLDPHCC